LVQTPGTQADWLAVRRSTSNTMNIALVCASTSRMSGDACGPNTLMSKRNEVNGEMPAPASRSAGQLLKFGLPAPSPSVALVLPLNARMRIGIPSGSLNSNEVV